MKLGDILKKVSSFGDSPIGSILTSVIPGLGAAEQILDVLVGAGIKPDSTVAEVEKQMGHMTAAQRLELEGKEFDVQIIESNNWAAVALAQEQNKGATRPQIASDMSDGFISFAKYSFLIVTLSVLLDMVLYVVYYMNPSEHITLHQPLTPKVLEGLAWFSGAYAIPMMNIIISYFAKRSDDKRTASAAASNQPIPPPGGLMATIKSVLKR